MDSAGKRITKPPVRLIDQILQPEILNLSESNMAPIVTMSTATGPTDTLSVSSGQSAPRTTTTDETIQKMFVQLLANQRANDAGIRGMREDMTAQWDQCLERWQAIDTRTTKLEDDQARSEHRTIKMNETIEENTRRIVSLEDEVVAIRSDLCRLVQQSNTISHPNVVTQPPTAHIVIGRGTTRYVSGFSSI